MSRRLPVNFPREGRDRGLGYAGGIGNVLAGMGSWQVDTQWGRGASYQPGHPGLYPVAANPMSYYPRAGAARVLGPSSASPVVGRPFSATRLPTMGHPLHRTPVTAPGATLRNPGMYGEGEEFAVRVPSKIVWGSMAVAAGLGAIWIFARNRKRGAPA